MIERLKPQPCSEQTKAQAQEILAAILFSPDMEGRLRAFICNTIEAEGPRSLEFEARIEARWKECAKDIKDESETAGATGRDDWWREILDEAGIEVTGEDSTAPVITLKEDHPELERFTGIEDAYNEMVYKVADMVEVIKAHTGEEL